MKIVLFGGSGFIGKHLISYFTKKGAHVVLVSRTKRNIHLEKRLGAKNGIERHSGVNDGAQLLAQVNSLVQYVTWKELQQDVGLLEQADAFINLAGETINQRWTANAKEKILESRVCSTKTVTGIVQRLHSRPKVVINGSAIGIYGMSDTVVFDETSTQSGNDFLAKVVKEWESTADLMKPYTRIIKLRLGVVLGKDGGALPKMILPYKLFVGGKVGTGKQWLSWIHIGDLVQLIEHCIINETINGAINATAPTPVTNDEFGRTVGQVLRRPHLFPVPAFVLKLMFGEMSRLLLDGQKVLPKNALESGFHFNYPTVEKACKDLLR
ncbi:TIGR01777 family oxidoreductase [Calidifontibacillus oryziterrae]|uniref:TIGR01777 family oxidoreductase n=1 Tax=Calidifontibacillus oryziterrae TaxID=1191699 RepID=UPI0002F1432A|nr:TIGR01777 family oxidoreductase [Calidifontibacillus oryziterrae]